eukprot:symbB.v1.2.007890.t1/scaffold489.1/size197246/8
MERSAAKMLEIEVQKEDLTSSVRALTADVRACRQEVEQEHEQCQMMKLEVKEAQEKQEALFVEVQAAQNFAAEATSRAEEEQRERLRDLQDFQRILRQHQNHLDLQQRKEIWEELQDAIHRSGEVSLDVDSEQCDDERVDTENCAYQTTTSGSSCRDYCAARGRSCVKSTAEISACCAKVPGDVTTSPIEGSCDDTAVEQFLQRLFVGFLVQPGPYDSW